MAFVTTQEISGASVYGIPQVSYTVDGVSGQDLAMAVAQASLKQAVAFEQECSALTAMVKQRMKKSDDLGQALSTITELKGLFDPDDMDPDDELYHDPDDEDLAGFHIDDKLREIKATLLAYNMEKAEGYKEDDDDESAYFSWDDEDGIYITRADINYLDNDVKYEIDRENNDLQQDLLTVQSMFSKRDNAFSNASQLVDKILSAAQSMIGNMGS